MHAQPEVVRDRTLDSRLHDARRRAKSWVMTDLLEAVEVVKVFGALRANDSVNLHVKSGEIHAFLGENGAGKSTLVKMIYGVLQPTSGEFRWKGHRVSLANPAYARKLGIGMVFQHFSLFEQLTVAENIALALDDAFDLAALSKKIARISQDYGLPLQPAARVYDLSVGERQRIEIVRCLLQEPELLIMDEPTAVLTPLEAEQLFIVLTRLASEGCAVIYISHRLEEVKRLCHQVTVLRHGRVVASDLDPQIETAASLARLMVGGDVHAVQALRASRNGDIRLQLNEISQTADGPFGVALKDISLAVRAFEVVGIAGVAGNGQGELFDVLSGERKLPRADMLLMDGVARGMQGINQRRSAGAAFVAEERLGHGAAPGFVLSENILLSRHFTDDALVKNGLLRRGGAQAVSERVIKAFDVRMGKPDPEARALSGGNLQKFVVGRELDREPGILVIHQPTWGVDAGAAAVIRQAIVDLAAKGAAVLVISQDLDEIFEISDRIAVISRGELSDAIVTHEMTAERIGLLMAGLDETHSHEGSFAHSA